MTDKSIYVDKTENNIEFLMIEEKEGEQYKYGAISLQVPAPKHTELEALYQLLRQYYGDI